MSDLGGSHSWLLDVGGGAPRAMRARGPATARPPDDALGLGPIARSRSLGDRVERLVATSGQTAILKLGGFLSPETERALYEDLLDSDSHRTPRLLASGPGWLLLEDVASQPLPIESSVEAYRQLALVHARLAPSVARAPQSLLSLLADGPLSATSTDAIAQRVEALAGLVAESVADDAWEIGSTERDAIDVLRHWADAAAPRLIGTGDVTVLHGDFQRSNWLGRVGDMRFVDWELASLGPGLLDLGYLDPDGPGAGHAPAGRAALEAADAYGATPRLLADAVIWSAICGAALRLADFLREQPRSRTPRDLLPGRAAALIRYAATRASRL